MKQKNRFHEKQNFLFNLDRSLKLQFAKKLKRQQTTKKKQKMSKTQKKEEVWRFDIINFLIQRIGATRYLEIGVEDGDSINAVKCQKKHGVDPASRNATHKLESDEFFEMLAPHVKYDIVFVDGLHVADQAERDIVNAINHLSLGGFIIVHDCNPKLEWRFACEPPLTARPAPKPCRPLAASP